jgi:thiamine biosynthesis lipoprotein
MPRLWLLLPLLLFAHGVRAEAPLAPGCAGVQTRSGVAMGTKVQIVVCPTRPDAAGEAAAKSAADQGFAEFGRLEGLWTTWSPLSDVSRINAAAGKQPVTVSAETLAVLQAALAGSVKSGGLFDVTFAPLGEVWLFDTPPGSHEPTKLARVPTQAEVKERLAHVGFTHLLIDPPRRTAFLDEPGRAIHLGGIGKGAGVDVVVALLRRLGFRDFAVQAGGDLYCGGQNGQRPWRVGIAHPRQKDALIGSLHVRDAAFSTSGDYERFAIIAGRRYHHILDTRTGFPATASQSVTVLARSAIDAEIQTKTAFILGGAAGLDFLQVNGSRGLIVDANGKVWQSEGLAVVRP